LTYYQISRVENNDSTAEDDRRKAETVVEDITSAELQFKEVSILIRSHEVMLHLCKKKVHSKESENSRFR